MKYKERKKKKKKKKCGHFIQLDIVPHFADLDHQRVETSPLTPAGYS